MSARGLGALFFALATAACVTHGNVPRGTSLSDLGGDSVVVMGVTPRYRVEIGKSFAADDKLEISVWPPEALSSYPEGGYIVGRVSARTGRELHHLAAILPEGYGLFARQFMPCNGEETATFEAPPGKVIYVGDVTFSEVNEKLAVRYSSNPEAARQYLAEAYPELVTSFESQPFVLRTISNRGCDPTHITVPIYLPKSK